MCMNRMILLSITLLCVNAGPSPKPISLNIRTAEDLAVACSASPTSAGNAALLNFCNGFAQGVLQTTQQKICFPKPPPKRSETMKQFAAWVQADTARRKEVASASFIKFMTERFPC